MYRFFLFVEFLHNHFGGIWHLLVVGVEDFLAYDFGDEEPRGLVGERVFAEIGFSLGQELHNARHQRLHVEVLESRHGENLGGRKDFLPAVDDCLEVGVSLEQVDFVYHQQHGHFLEGHLCQKVGVLGGVFHHVGNVDEHVGIGEGSLAECEHAFLHLVSRREHTGGVGEHYLVFGSVDDTHYAVARCLRLGGDDAYALTHQIVHERGLAYVGVSNDVHET